MSPKQFAGQGVKAGAGRACPTCGVRYDVGIGGWRCGHGVTRSSTRQQKIVAALVRRDEVSPAPLAGTEGGASTAVGVSSEDRASAQRIVAGSNPTPPTENPPLAGDNICSHGFVTWLDCTACTYAADWDDGEPYPGAWA